MDDIKSKSQKKRDAAALQVLGNQLMTLSDEALEALPLSDVLRQALVAARTIKSHGATRRQSQLIGKLMRSADHEAIAAMFEEMQAEDRAQTAQFHAAEVWRDKLLDKGVDALSEFITLFQPEDIQHLRQLIKKASSAKTAELQKAARKVLFRYIRSYV